MVNLCLSFPKDRVRKTEGADGPGELVSFKIKKGEASFAGVRRINAP